jgi:signal transduction histidine kinase
MSTRVDGAELARLQALAAQASARVLGNFAHGLNNQLATIQGSLDLLERRLASAEPGTLDPNVARLLGRASDAVLASGALTGRMRRLARSAAEPDEPRDVPEMLAELAELGLAGLGGPSLELAAGAAIAPTVPVADVLWPALLALAGAACDDLGRGSVVRVEAENRPEPGGPGFVVVRLSCPRPMPVTASLAARDLAPPLSRRNITVRVLNAGAEGPASIELILPAART